MSKPLVELILRYESDTFSAAASGIDSPEAHLVADELAARWAARCLDGHQISDVLAAIGHFARCEPGQDIRVNTRIR